MVGLVGSHHDKDTASLEAHSTPTIQAAQAARQHHDHTPVPQSQAYYEKSPQFSSHQQSKAGGDAAAAGGGGGSACGGGSIPRTGQTIASPMSPPSPTSPSLPSMPQSMPSLEKLAIPFVPSMNSMNSMNSMQSTQSMHSVSSSPLKTSSKPSQHPKVKSPREIPATFPTISPQSSPMHFGESSSSVGDNVDGGDTNCEDIHTEPMHDTRINQPTYSTDSSANPQSNKSKKLNKLLKPSLTMTKAQYLQLHANIPPSKLRNIILTQIFPTDDVAYLKRLVKDVGGWEYVFRFLWFDGSKDSTYGRSGAAGGSGRGAGGAAGKGMSGGAGVNDTFNSFNANLSRGWSGTSGMSGMTNISGMTESSRTFNSSFSSTTSANGSTGNKSNIGGSFGSSSGVAPKVSSSFGRKNSLENIFGANAGVKIGGAKVGPPRNGMGGSVGGTASDLSVTLGARSSGKNDTGKMGGGAAARHTQGGGERGRTWIQYCCYHNAHQCLRWIFCEIVKHCSETEDANNIGNEPHHGSDEDAYKEGNEEQWGNSHFSQFCNHSETSQFNQLSSHRHNTEATIGMIQEHDDETDEDTVAKNEKHREHEENGEHNDDFYQEEIKESLRNSKAVQIIQQLIFHPSPRYCGTHYLSVAALRNSYHCLTLLLQWGCIDPNIHINDYGSTLAHLATWKNHVDCLRVLALGVHAVPFTDFEEHDEEEDEGTFSLNNGFDVCLGGAKEVDVFSIGSVYTEGESKNLLQSPPRNDLPLPSITLTNRKLFTAEWNCTDAKGDTPMHVAAREGRLESMQFYLDLIIAAATAASDGVLLKAIGHVNNDGAGLDGNKSGTEGNFSSFSGHTMYSSHGGLTVAHGVIDFSIRNHDGMDCTALAAMHNQVDILNLLSRAIAQLNEIEAEANTESSAEVEDPCSPCSHGPWQNPLSILQSYSYDRTHPTSKSSSNTAPPQSHPSQQTHMPLRQRAKSEEPVPNYKRTRSMPGVPAEKAPNTPTSLHASIHATNHLKHLAATFMAPVPSTNLPNQSNNPQSTNQHNGHHPLSLHYHYPTLNLRNPFEQHNHETPLHVAARCGNRDAVRALFESGDLCDVTARDSFGKTALHVAVEMGRLEVCKFFAGLGVEQFEGFDVVDILGRTPLYIACLKGDPSLAKILTPISNWRIVCHERRKSADGPLYVNVAHQPALHAAVARDHVNTVSVLLQCGVDVDQTDVDGRTAISAAAKLGYYEMCQMLILHGANVNTRSNRGGPTPYQKAKKYKHHNVADLLHEFGGR